MFRVAYEPLGPLCFVCVYCYFLIGHSGLKWMFLAPFPGMSITLSASWACRLACIHPEPLSEIPFYNLELQWEPSTCSLAEQPHFPAFGLSPHWQIQLSPLSRAGLMYKIKRSPGLCSTGQEWSEDTVNLHLTLDGRPWKLTLTLKLDSESLNAKMILGEKKSIQDDRVFHQSFWTSLFFFKCVCYCHHAARDSLMVLPHFWV